MKTGDFDLDIELSKYLEEAIRCGTGRMVFITTGTKRKRHGKKFMFVFKKTLKR
jgi:hypothetical protein